jgi:hypothetical protein
MQDLLTLTIEAIATVSALYFATGFVLTICARRTAPAVELPTQDEVDRVIEALEIAAVVLEMEPEPIEVEAIVAADPEPTVPEWAALGVPQLRTECQVRGIRWSNAHGRNRHLKKAEMVAALAGA